MTGQNCATSSSTDTSSETVMSLMAGRVLPTSTTSVPRLNSSLKATHRIMPETYVCTTLVDANSIIAIYIWATCCAVTLKLCLGNMLHSGAYKVHLYMIQQTVHRPHSRNLAARCTMVTCHAEDTGTSPQTGLIQDRTSNLIVTAGISHSPPSKQQAQNEGFPRPNQDVCFYHAQVHHSDKVLTV